MLPNNDLERLIAEKRHEIETEKILLGLSPPALECNFENTDSKKNGNYESSVNAKLRKSVRIDDSARSKERDRTDHAGQKREGEEIVPEIPAELERYIRRYLGLPVMLKAGEFSPNNPLVRGERTGPTDVLLGLGEYERRRNTLRKIRQQQYREYLDEQAKKKQEAKEQAERERREREERERQREEELERARRDDEERRASVCYVPAVASKPTGNSNKVDAGVQAGAGAPHSVAVQTDDAAELYRLSPSPAKWQAERELSPRTVADERPAQAARSHTTWQNDWPAGAGRRDSARRRSYGDTDDRPAYLKRPSRERLLSDLRHSYMPSIFDSDAIHMRNLQAEKDAAERRQYYQQELRDQILEQQRIREERRTREKMLEQAEMRRLEEQLRMLRAAQDKESVRQKDISAAVKESSTEFERKRTTLQKEIDLEHENLLLARTQPHRLSTTPHSDPNLKLPTFYNKNNKLPFSTNIPHNSIFNPNYDVDSYLRKNLNPKNTTFKSNFDIPITEVDNKNVVIEKAIIHDRPKEKPRIERDKKHESSYNPHEIIDETPIPVLRHSPKLSEVRDDEVLSPEMKKVDDKWKVPAVQKNILKTLPNDDGKSVSILTQLGSIRRQLQLEQLRLDSMSKRD